MFKGNSVRHYNMNLDILFVKMFQNPEIFEKKKTTTKNKTKTQQHVMLTIVLPWMHLRPVFLSIFRFAFVNLSLQQNESGN